MDLDFLMNGEAKQISIALGLIYLGVLYFLPEKAAKKIEPIGKLLGFLAGSPGGFKAKK